MSKEEQSSSQSKTKIDETTTSQNVMSHYTTIITDLERLTVLDFLGSFDIHPEVQTSARDLAISVKDLTKRIKEYGTSTLNDLGLFLDSLFKNSMLNKFSLNEAFNIVSSISKKLDSMDEMANQYLGTKNPEQPVSHGLKSSEDCPHKPKITAAEDNTPAGKRDSMFSMRSKYSPVF